MTNNLHKNVQGDKISLENWRTHPYNRIAFSKVDKILPYEVIHKGTKKINFYSKTQDISLFKFSNKYNENTIAPNIALILMTFLLNPMKVLIRLNAIKAKRDSNKTT